MADQEGDGASRSTVLATSPVQDEGEGATTPTRGPTAAEIYGVCAERGPAFYAPLMARFQIAILTPTIITKLVVETDNAEVVAMEIPYNNWTVTTTNGVATGTTTENTTPYTTFWFWVGLSPHADTKEYIDISAVATTADGSTIAHVIPRETGEQVSTDSTNSTEVDTSSSDTQYPMLRVPNRSQTSNSLPAEPAASSATVAPCRIGETATRSGTKNNGSSSNESSTKVTVLFAIAGIVMVSGLVGLSVRARRQGKRNKSNRK